MKRSYLLTTFLFLIFAAAGYGQGIRADNTAKYLGDGRYDWTVYIAGSADELKKITYVQYTLHPTFKDPVRKVTNGAGRYPFALSLNGWDEFSIGVKIVYRDGTTASFAYKLNLFNRHRLSKIKVSRH
jgi:transcription initiation factor IIF auxiliary subunit